MMNLPEKLAIRGIRFMRMLPLFLGSPALQPPVRKLQTIALSCDIQLKPLQMAHTDDGLGRFGISFNS
jgi:hypothetical protein